MPVRKLPGHISGTHRAWKQRKRREWKAVLKAVDAFRMGCAYTPVYNNLSEVGENGRSKAPWANFEPVVQDITTRLSFKRWGR